MDLFDVDSVRASFLPSPWSFAGWGRPAHWCPDEESDGRHVRLLVHPSEVHQAHHCCGLGRGEHPTQPLQGRLWGGILAMLWKAQSCSRSAWWPRQTHPGWAWKMAWPEGQSALDCLKGPFVTMFPNSLLLGPNRGKLDYNFLHVLSRSTLGRVAIPRRSKCLGQAWREVDWRPMSLLTSQWTVPKPGKVRGGFTQRSHCCFLGNKGIFVTFHGQ